MWPQLVNWGWVNQYALLIGIILGVVVYLFVIWQTSKNDLKTNPIFDIAFLNVIVGLVIARSIAMLANADAYLEAGWGILPLLTDELGNASFAWLNPWTFFKFDDGNFFLPAMFLGMLLSVFMIYINSNQKKSVFVLLEKVTWAWLWSIIFVLAGMLVSGWFNGVETNGFFNLVYVDGKNRFPLQLVQILAQLLLVGILLLLTKIKINLDKSILLVGVYCLLYGLNEFFLRFYAADYSPEIFSNLDFYQAIELVISSIGLVFVVISTKTLAQTKLAKKGTFPERKNRMTDIRNDPKFVRRNNFAMSFSDRQQKFADNLPLREKLFGKINSLRRREQP